jgi:hypothetical protein
MGHATSRIARPRRPTPRSAKQRQASPRIATYWHIAVLGAALARVPHAPFPPRHAALCEGPRPLRRIPTHRHPSLHIGISPNPAAHAPTARSQHPTPHRPLCTHCSPLSPVAPPPATALSRCSTPLSLKVSTVAVCDHATDGRSDENESRWANCDVFLSEANE